MNYIDKEGELSGKGEGVGEFIQIVEANFVKEKNRICVSNNMII
jgi:hypothetical protein